MLKLKKLHRIPMNLYLIPIDEAASQSDDTSDTSDVLDTSESELVHADDKNDEEEGRRMSRNVFEQQSGGEKKDEHVLSHDALKALSPTLALAVR